MTKDKALEMALMFIERVNRDGWILEDFEPQMYEAITAIKEALETKDEPVSCAECGADGGHALYCVACAEKFIAQTETKDEPVAIVISESEANVTHSWWHEPALPIGTKLYIKEKNT